MMSCMHILYAQQPVKKNVAATPQPVEEIKIVHSDLTLINVQEGNEQKVLTGDVQLFHDSSFLYCDSARIDGMIVSAYKNVVIRRNDTIQIFADSLKYNGSTKTCDLFGEVILVSGGQTLTTKKLHYDLNTDIASYLTGATLRSNSTALKSKKGYYHVKENLAYFAGQVQMTDPEIQLRTDSLEFDTKTHTAIFVAPTLMEKNDRKIYCEGGHYDVENKTAEFLGNPQFQEKDRKAASDRMVYDGKINEIKLYDHVKFVDSTTSLEGDTVFYDQKNKVMTLYGQGFVVTKDGKVESSKKLVYNEGSGIFTTNGRSALKDSTNILEADMIRRDGNSGNLMAIGKVNYTDTASHSMIDGDSLFFNKNENRVIAVGKGRQPLFRSYDNPQDTFYLQGDTLIAFQHDTITKKKTILAYHKVTVFRSDVQAICDSLAYSETDSLFTLYKNPVIWSDTSQFFADTIRIRQENHKLKNIFLRQNALIINSPDLKFFNQIKGRNIRADFDSTNLSFVDVSGNAEAVYYIRDDRNAYIGVNKIICSNIQVTFGNNKVDRIYFLTKPDGTMFPMIGTDHTKLRLKEFKWLFTEKPKKEHFVVLNLPLQ